MRFSLALLVLLAVLADGVQSGLKPYMSDCGDSSYLLHYQNCKADFERGKPVVVESEKELLKANITAGKVHAQFRRCGGFDSRDRWPSFLTISATVATRRRNCPSGSERSSTPVLTAASLVLSRILSECL